jgi:hypothetical protein
MLDIATRYPSQCDYWIPSVYVLHIIRKGKICVGFLIKMIILLWLAAPLGYVVPPVAKQCVGVRGQAGYHPPPLEPTATHRVSLPRGRPASGQARLPTSRNCQIEAIRDLISPWLGKDFAH